ncbi:MAG: CHASE3 domain-containing protein, partial [Chitinophagaceae bacterium]
MSIPKRIISLLLAGIICIFLIFLFGRRESIRARVADNWVNHSFQVILEMDRLPETTAQLQSFSKDYLISRNPIFKSQFQQTEQKIQQRINLLFGLTRDNLRQQRNLDSLQQSFKRGLYYYNQEISPSRISSKKSDPNPYDSLTSMAILRENYLIQKMLGIEDILLKKRSMANEMAKSRFFYALVWGCITIFLFF